MKKKKLLAKIESQNNLIDVLYKDIDTLLGDDEMEKKFVRSQRIFRKRFDAIILFGDYNPKL